MRISGHCLCGAVRFTAKGEPLVVMNCHCTECRRATGAAYATLLFYQRADVERTGETRTFEHDADSGTRMIKHFCPKCGSPMFSEVASRPEIFGLRAGVIEETDVVRPQGNVWISSKIASTPVDPDLPAYPNNRS